MCSVEPAVRCRRTWYSWCRVAVTRGQPWQPDGRAACTCGRRAASAAVGEGCWRGGWMGGGCARLCSADWRCSATEGTEACQHHPIPTSPSAIGPHGQHGGESCSTLLTPNTRTHTHTRTQSLAPPWPLSLHQPNNLASAARIAHRIARITLSLHPPKLTHSLFS